MQLTRKIVHGLAMGLTVLAGLAGTAALADTLTFTATMNGASERPTPTLSTASGFATVTLTGNTLTVVEQFTGLFDVASAAHIHCCSGPNATAPVEIPFLNFPQTTSGTYSNVFDLSTYTFATSGFTEAQFLAGLESGLAYVNIHDSLYPGGEIRGQLLPAATTPEPGSFLLLGTGLAGLLSLKRRFVGQMPGTH